MGGGLQVLASTLLLIFTLLFMWAAVPTEQTLDLKFPNVVVLSGFGVDKIDPISFDNNSLPEVLPAEAGNFNGFYQFDPLFYSKTFDRFIPWEERDKAMVFACTMGCRPLNTSAAEVRLVLVHSSPDVKRNLWYLLELRDDDVNSPIVYARTKYRKSATYQVPWTTVTDGGETMKPRDLKDVYMYTAWDAFRFDTPMKWGVSATLVGMIVLWCRMKEKDD
mmetsp:Transcript_56344/g.101266  ORF Transcript_56344/g.101266 Transcript_56344/m.101266 type:complete len:220 (+) Transcript_56344:100-759(+)